MAGNDEVVDSPSDWVAEHIKQYVATGGKEGHIWQGAPTLLLTVRGRSSGVWRRSALIYGVYPDGELAAGDKRERYVIVASKGGAPEHPQWFRNLEVNPRVRVQIGDEEFDADARLATADEKPRLWSLMAGIWPDYDNYQLKTVRQIPVVVLERV
jgi:deazaflavin-dependent oxidoreductase (nitroreductase family)